MNMEETEKPRRAATGLIETQPAVVTGVTLRMSLAQYFALRAAVTGYGPMEGAWSAFLDVDKALNARGVYRPVGPLPSR